MSRRAKLYVLDEPIGGVDPAARDYILDTILNNFEQGASILISTHLISCLLYTSKEKRKFIKKVLHLPLSEMVMW